MGCPHFLPYPPRIENTEDDQHQHLDFKYPTGYGPLMNYLIQQTQTCSLLSIHRSVICEQKTLSPAVLIALQQVTWGM